jgi:predicted PurR-regulated permease PerM
MAVENLVTRLQKTFSRGFSILATYVLLLMFIFSGLVIVVPFVIQQMADMVTLLLSKINVIQNAIQSNGLAVFIQESFLPGQLKDSLLEIIQSGNRMESVQ